MTAPLLTTVLASAPANRPYAKFDVPVWVWGAFAVLVALLVLLDLLLVHRTPHVISVREATVESAVWIAIGLGFALVVLWWQGGQASGEYIAGYLIEKSLSVDNVFVWALLFSFFGVPAQYQFRVLFWGVFGALVLRAMFIFAGVALIERFDWVLYVFGTFLLFTALKITRQSGVEVHPERNPVLKIVRRVIPSARDYDGQKLFTRRSGRLLATPLFAVLVLVEATDVVFAVDSVPAILAVSREPFIVFASNAFAILGLRSLYFLLAGMAQRFRYLNVGLGVILGFVGLKMLLADVFHVPISISLGVIATVLGIAVWASIRAERRSPGGGASHAAPSGGPGASHAAPSRSPSPKAENGPPSPDGRRSSIRRDGNLRDERPDHPVTGPSRERRDG